MGFTIQDLMIFSQERYDMKYVAGRKAWSNSISWAHLLEDDSSLKAFEGKELVVTSGKGFDTEKKLIHFLGDLVQINAAGLVLVTGDVYQEVPSAVADFCDRIDFPILTVPGIHSTAEVIREIGMQILFQATTDEQITKYLLNAIKAPKNVEDYRKDLMPHFDVLGDFQVTLVTAEGLKEMDTVERRKISYGIQIYMENITHNAAFLYYNGAFLVITNDVTDEELDEIIEGFVQNAKRRMRDVPVYVGVGSKVYGVEKLYESYCRAKSAASMAMREKRDCVYFDKMGIYRVLYSIKDRDILLDMLNETLRPLMEYDKHHDSNYVETLEAYLKYNGSIQEVSEATFTHRNTVIYRMNNIRRILGCKLETVEERTPYLLAFYIRKMF